MTSFRMYHDVRDPRLLLARLLQKRVLNEGKQAVVTVADQGAAAELDRYLWVFEQGSFLPHCLVEDEVAARTPVVIATQESDAGLVPVREVMVQMAGTGEPQMHAAAASCQDCVTIVPASSSSLDGWRALHDDLKRRGHATKAIAYAK